MLPVGYLPCTQDPPSGANMGRVVDELIAEAQAAEASGWDGCFLTEHHQQEDGYLPNPLLLAGLVGMKTERIKVGTCVLLMPLHHPVHVAEDCAVIDLATKGRVVLSVGVGYQPHDFDAFGISIKERASRTEEAIDIIRKAGLENVSLLKGSISIIKILLLLPVQRSSQVHRFGWHHGRLLGCVEQVVWPMAGSPIQSKVSALSKTMRLAIVRPQKRRAASPFICLMRDAIVSDSMAGAEAASEPTMYTHRFYFEYDAYVPDEHIKDVKSPEELTFATASKERLIVGSPDDCLEQLQMWKEAIQPDYLIMRFRQPGGPSHENTLQAIRAFGEKVIPNL